MILYQQIYVFTFQVCSLQFDRKDIPMNKLVATSLESNFYLYDLRTQHPTKGFTSLSEKVQNLLIKGLLAFINFAGS